MNVSLIPVRIRLRDEQHQRELVRFLRHHYEKEIRVTEVEEGILLTDEEGNAPGRIMLRHDRDGNDPESLWQSADVIAKMLIRQSRASDMESRNELREAPLGEFHEPGVWRRFPSLCCVYSPAGGCGKTTFSMAYAEILARKYPQKKVLYWNLEGASDWKLFMQAEGRYQMTDYIYGILIGEKDHVRDDLEEMAVRQENGIYFIRPGASLRDLADLDYDDLIHVLEAMSGSFSYIICDMNTAFEPINSPLLRMAGRRYLILGHTAGASYKFRDFVDHLEYRGLKNELFDERTVVLCPSNTTEPTWLRGKEAAVERLPVLPHPSRLYREAGGKLRFRTDSDFYGRIQQMVGMS